GLGNLSEIIFKRLDANGDGKVTKEEIKKAAENRGNGQFNITEMLDKLFDKLDTDKDGALSAAEFKKFGDILRERLGTIYTAKLKELREKLRNRKPPQ